MRAKGNARVADSTRQPPRTGKTAANTRQVVLHSSKHLANARAFRYTARHAVGFPAAPFVSSTPSIGGLSPEALASGLFFAATHHGHTPRTAQAAGAVSSPLAPRTFRRLRGTLFSLLIAPMPASRTAAPSAGAFAASTTDTAHSSTPRTDGAFFMPGP